MKCGGLAGVGEYDGRILLALADRACVGLPRLCGACTSVSALDPMLVGSSVADLGVEPALGRLVGVGCRGGRDLLGTEDGAATEAASDPNDPS